MTPQYSTVKEWALCLFSKEHASSTWLRVKEEDEHKALRVVDSLLVVLFVAIVFVSIVTVHRFMALQQLKREHRIMQIERQEEA